MNGAESLVETLINNGVDVCFTNPGTSEMHMVAAIGKTDGMRSILGLFEGVCTGAADGYGRMAGKPACTLLHLGPGLSNGSANLHNAKKANSPVLNLIGDHATYHKKYDAPLTSDIIGLAHPVSDWVRTTESAENLPGDAVDAVVEASTGQGRISTLIVPADCAWNESVEPLPHKAAPAPGPVSEAAVGQAAELLTNGAVTMLLLGNLALSERALELANQISQKTGVRLYCDTFFTRMPRGEGRCQIDRLAYFAEQGVEQIKDVSQLIMVGTKAPVAFFAYPQKPSEYYGPDSVLHTLADVSQDAEDALLRLAIAVGAEDIAPIKTLLKKSEKGADELSPRTVAMSFAHYLPIQAIVIDEGATAGGGCYPSSAQSEPERKVVCIHGDGGAMYTIQSLWTMARENLDVCVIIMANRKYQILQIELARVGAQSMTKKTLDMLDIGNPDLNFVQLSEGMGVKATRVETIEAFNEAYIEAMTTHGPRLIEVVLP
jgi:acetolactate synthase-1/2/3 large subunit